MFGRQVARFAALALVVVVASGCLSAGKSAPLGPKVARVHAQFLT